MAILKGPLNYAAEGFPTGIQLEFDLPVFTYTELSFTQLERTIIQREVSDHYKKTLPLTILGTHSLLVIVRLSKRAIYKRD